MTTEANTRREIIDACLELTAKGLNQGTSGNISVRLGDAMLITPSATPYEKMSPEMIAAMDLSGEMTGEWDGPGKPSTEWRFHWKLLKERSDIGAVVHAHPPHCTALAMLRRPIPAAHYMVAAFGGLDVRCSGYATFGTDALSDEVLQAMQDRTACLMANHGMIAGGETLTKAMWRAGELETLAQQYVLALSVGDPVLLSQSDLAETLARFSDYGVRDG